MSSCINVRSVREEPCVWTSEQLLDVLAGVGGGELVDDVQRRLVVGVPDVDVHSGLRGRDRTEAFSMFTSELILCL